MRLNIDASGYISSYSQRRKKNIVEKLIINNNNDNNFANYQIINNFCLNIMTAVQSASDRR